MGFQLMQAIRKVTEEIIRFIAIKYLCYAEVLFFFMLRSPRSPAAAVAAKNSPQDCFLNAPTVLEEIILSLLGVFKITTNAFAMQRLYMPLTEPQLHGLITALCRT